MADKPHSSDARVIMDSLRRIVQALRKASGDPSATPDLTAAQIFLLRTLHTHPGASVNDLAALTHTHQSSVSEVVTRLEAKGLIDRRQAENDRRRMVLRLSPSGKMLVSQLRRTPQENMLDAIENLSPDIRSGLIAGLEALANAAAPGGSIPPLFFEEKDAP